MNHLRLAAGDIDRVQNARRPGRPSRNEPALESAVGRRAGHGFPVRIAANRHDHRFVGIDRDVAAAELIRQLCDVPLLVRIEIGGDTPRHRAEVESGPARRRFVGPIDRCRAWRHRLAAASSRRPPPRRMKYTSPVLRPVTSTCTRPSTTWLDFPRVQVDGVDSVAPREDQLLAVGRVRVLVEIQALAVGLARKPHHAVARFGLDPLGRRFGLSDGEASRRDASQIAEDMTERMQFFMRTIPSDRDSYGFLAYCRLLNSQDFPRHHHHWNNRPEIGTCAISATSTNRNSTNPGNRKSVSSHGATRAFLIATKNTKRHKNPSIQ